jgi:transglutaminase-like putative cysteine protease
MLCMLVLMSFLLIDQSLTLTAFVLADVTFALMYLFALEEGRWDWREWRRPLGPAIGLALKALPLMALIFVLFPRFSTGFGAGSQVVGKTGVSDQLRPGSVSNLIASDELVFRATFLDGILPPRQSLYWRGAVLDRSHGLDWDRSKEERNVAQPHTFGAQDIEVYLEPGYDRFLFALDNSTAVTFPDPYGHRVMRRDGRVFELSQPLRSRQRYYLSGGVEPMRQDGDLGPYLQVDNGPSPEMEKFLAPLRDKAPAVAVRELLDDFHKDGFRYSLQPPPTSSLDEFMFKTKTGFCEHFAGGMATILRYLKIPSRVVIGFQGGTPSFLDNYVSVRAHDAHAWVEYFDQTSKRWVRVDPTAQVDPLRITLGSESYLKGGNGWRPAWYARVQTLIDEVDAAWTVFLLRFDLARQKELLAKLGMEAVLFRALPVFLVLGMALILAVLYYFEAQRRETLSEDEALYRQLRRKLKRLGRLDKAPNEGPLHWLRRIEAARPDVAAAVAPILSELTVARFQSRPLSPERRRGLKRGIKRLTRLRRHRSLA